jgi:predicted nucleotidyltransferase
VLEELLGSRLRAKLLGWLFTHPHERFFVRQLTALLGEDSTNISRELARLAGLRVLITQREGLQRYYQANPSCPVFAELRGLVVKTIGLGDAVRTALAPLADRVSVAFLFGSFARAEETAGSDIDLFVVGKLALRDLGAILGPAKRALGREINPVVCTGAELKRKAAEKHHFISEVLKGPKVFLIGTADDLKRIAR